MSKKVLTGHVSRVINGVPVILAPGDPAPDWVTNPELLADAPRKAAPATPAPPTATAPVTPSVGDGLDALNLKELQEAAEAAEVSKKGSKKEIADRIRAKQAAAEPAATSEGAKESDESNSDRGEMLAKAQELGIEDAEDLTDAELQAALENEE